MKLWDSSSGVEVASFSTRHGLSHLEREGGRVLVGHTDGVVTSWPLAVGRSLLTVPSRDLLCPMFSHFSPGDVPRVEPTSLGRQVTALHKVSESVMMVGFSNGDLQMYEAEEDTRWTGWKVFESKIDLIGSECGFGLYTEDSEEDESMSGDDDTEDCEEDESMSGDDDCSTNSDFWDEDLNLNLSNIDMELFDSSPAESPAPRDVFTVWLVSGQTVLLATFHGKTLMSTFKLADIRSSVVDVKILNKEIILVFTKSGIVNVYHSSDCGQSSQNTLRPVNRFDTLHGVLTAVTFSDWDMFVTVGSDGKARFWSYLLEGKTFKPSQHSESSSFTSKPVGVALTRHRQKDLLLLGFEDGTLALVEMKDNHERFCQPLVVAGNGHGLKSLSVSGENLLMIHTDGLVSLWSTTGAEIAQYSRGSTAALLDRSVEGKVVMILAKNDLQLICPTESECEGVLSGHQGALTALATSGRSGVLFTAGQDGKVKRWESGYDRQAGGADSIVSVVAQPVILSLSKSGKLSHWLRDGKRVELRDSLQLEGDRFRMMTATNYNGQLFLTTVSGQGHIKVWLLLVTPSTFQATLKAELRLGQKILRLDAMIDSDDGKFSLVAAMEHTAHVFTFIEVGSTSRHRIVPKNALSIYCSEDELLSVKGEYPQVLQLQGPLRLFRRNYLLNHHLETRITAGEDGSIEFDDGEDGEARYQVHDQEVTEMKMTSRQELVTISLDGKVKVWSWESDSNKIYQTGEFSGHGPGLTCLDIDHEDNLVIGDAAGNVLSLSVIN